MTVSTVQNRRPVKRLAWHGATVAACSLVAVCACDEHPVDPKVGSRDLEVMAMHSREISRYRALDSSLRSLLVFRARTHSSEFDDVIRALSRLVCERFDQGVMVKIDNEPIDRLYPLDLLDECTEIGCVSCRLGNGTYQAGAAFGGRAPDPL